MLPSKGGGRIRDGQQIKLPLHTCVPSEPFPSLLHNFVKKTQKRHCDKELNIISLREALKKIVFLGIFLKLEDPPPPPLLGTFRSKNVNFGQI